MNSTNSIIVVIDFIQFDAGEGYAFNNQIERWVNLKLIVNNNGKYEKTICKSGNGEIHFTNIHDTYNAQEKILDAFIELDALDKLIRIENHTIELVSLGELFNSKNYISNLNEVAL